MRQNFSSKSSAFFWWVFDQNSIVWLSRILHLHYHQNMFHQNIRILKNHSFKFPDDDKNYFFLNNRMWKTFERQSTVGVFALNAVLKEKNFDENNSNASNTYQTAKIGLMSRFILMKSLFSNKLHQTQFFSSFCYFSIFNENMVHLKCVKSFIKIASLIDFDESFDAFAPAFSVQQKRQ